MKSYLIFRPWAMKALSLLAMISFLSACRRDCDNPDPIRINYSGFDSSDLSTVIVGRYAPGSKFSQLVYLDTLDFSRPNPPDARLIFTNKYAIYDSSNWTAFVVLSDNYDWQFEVPAIGRTDRIWDYTIKHDTRPGGMDGKASNRCYSGYEYVHNGNKVVVPKDARESGYNGPTEPIVKK